MRKTLLGIAVACLAAGGAFAKDPVGTQVLPIEIVSETFYISCINEYVVNHLFGETRYHEFETPSGTIHVIDNWSVESYLVSQSTDKVWHGYGNGPFQMNAKLEKGEVAQYVSRGRFVPLEGQHAPELITQDTWKITVNANGELVVEHEEVPNGVGFHCVGPEK